MNSISLLLSYVYNSGLIIGFVIAIAIATIINVSVILWNEKKKTNGEKRCSDYMHKKEKEVTKK